MLEQQGERNIKETVQRGVAGWGCIHSSPGSVLVLYTIVIHMLHSLLVQWYQCIYNIGGHSLYGIQDLEDPAASVSDMLLKA